MAKQLKINIKNAQIAEAVNLNSLKNKLAEKKSTETTEPQTPKSDESKSRSSLETSSTASVSAPAAEEQPRIKARSKSVFEETPPPEAKVKPPVVSPTEEAPSQQAEPSFEEEAKQVKAKAAKKKTSEELRQEIFAEEIAEQEERKKSEEQQSKVVISPSEPVPTPVVATPEPLPVVIPPKPAAPQPTPPAAQISKTPAPSTTPYVKLGPTGRHVKDLLPPKPAPKPEVRKPERAETEGRPKNLPPRRPDQRFDRNRPSRPPYASLDKSHPPRERPHREPAAPANVPPHEASDKHALRNKGKTREFETTAPAPDSEAEAFKKNLKPSKFKEFKDVKTTKRPEASKDFNPRDRQGLQLADEEATVWRKRRPVKQRYVQEETTIRPTSLKVRIPISIKDLAAEMKLKASQLIQKLFLQGMIVTLNDLMNDETTIQLLGHEFGCEISIDTSEEQRLRITDKSIEEEVAASNPDELVIRPPVVAFMGHVDHGKTSLIDAIRKSNRTAGEAGAITQHIGAFRCHTPVGDIAILDTPGHEAFSAMRARGAHVTDIIVLVVAGDEGIRQQTLEAIQHAKSANVTIVVAINKCDKPNFNAENVYRQLSEHELLPEAWGGQTITINCSAATGEGIPQLLEMLALQAEILELQANPQTRARGAVLESEMHKGMGAVATVLVQNGTLKLGDALVFGNNWGRIKTMKDEFGKDLKQAGPSTPVEITGMSDLPEAGDEFIVVKSEREAREIAEARQIGSKQFSFHQKKKHSMENLLQQASAVQKKVLNLVLRADVQGSLEAIKTALEKVHSEKAELNIIYAGVGEISESDVQLAAASKAVILGFHTAIESHADAFVKQLGVQVRLHDIIYHAIDDVKLLMVGLLDKIAIETEKGKAEVKAIFKSSSVGSIAGCQVIEGAVARNHQVRVRRKDEVIWKGSISSLKRVKEDVREVQKGFECGILLNGYNALEVGDIIEAYDITYITQQL